MAPGAVEGMSERTTFATTTLCTLSIPLAVAMNRPLLAGSVALTTAVTVYVKPETGPKECELLPQAVVHCPTTSFWKFTTPGPLTRWRASAIPDSATKWTWLAPRASRVATMSALAMRVLVAVATMNAIRVNKAIAMAMPASLGRRRLRGERMAGRGSNPDATAAPPSARLTPPGWRRRAREGRRHVRGTSCAPTVTTVTAGPSSRPRRGTPPRRAIRTAPHADHRAPAQRRPALHGRASRPDARPRDARLPRRAPARRRHPLQAQHPFGGRAPPAHRGDPRRRRRGAPAGRARPRGRARRPAAAAVHAFPARRRGGRTARPPSR